MSNSWNKCVSVFDNLMMAGCDMELIERFFQLEAAREADAQFALLKTHRQSLLDNLHDTQTALNNLDGLLRKIRQNEKQQGKKRNPNRN